MSCHLAVMVFPKQTQKWNMWGRQTIPRAFLTSSIFVKRGWTGSFHPCSSKMQETGASAHYRLSWREVWLPPWHVLMIWCSCLLRWHPVYEFSNLRGKELLVFPQRYNLEISGPQIFKAVVLILNRKRKNQWKPWFGFLQADSVRVFIVQKFLKFQTNTSECRNGERFLWALNFPHTWWSLGCVFKKEHLLCVYLSSLEQLRVQADLFISSLHRTIAASMYT